MEQFTDVTAFSHHIVHRRTDARILDQGGTNNSISTGLKLKTEPEKDLSLIQQEEGRRVV
jgi:hypothetical protein